MICAACVCLTLMEDMRMCTVWLEVMSISAKPPAPEAAAAAAAAAAVLQQLANRVGFAGLARRVHLTCCSLSAEQWSIWRQ
jgi:hypothetical protein